MGNGRADWSMLYTGRQLYPARYLALGRLSRRVGYRRL